MASNYTFSNSRYDVGGCNFLTTSKLIQYFNSYIRVHINAIDWFRKRFSRQWSTFFFIIIKINIFRVLQYLNEQMKGNTLKVMLF